MEQRLAKLVTDMLEQQARVRDCSCSGLLTCDKPHCRNAMRDISPKILPNTEVRSASSTAGLSGVTSSNAVSGPQPVILNLSQLQGSNGLLILSSQASTPISILHSQQPTATPTTLRLEAAPTEQAPQLAQLRITTPTKAPAAVPNSAQPPSHLTPQEAKKLSHLVNKRRAQTAGRSLLRCNQNRSSEGQGQTKGQFKIQGQTLDQRQNQNEGQGQVPVLSSTQPGLVQIGGVRQGGHCSPGATVTSLQDSSNLPQGQGQLLLPQSMMPSSATGQGEGQGGSMAVESSVLTLDQIKQEDSSARLLGDVQLSGYGETGDGELPTLQSMSPPPALALSTSEMDTLESSMELTTPGTFGGESLAREGKEARLETLASQLPATVPTSLTGNVQLQNLHDFTAQALPFSSEDIQQLCPATAPTSAAAMHTGGTGPSLPVTMDSPPASDLYTSQFDSMDDTLDFLKDLENYNQAVAPPPAVTTVTSTTTSGTLSSLAAGLKDSRAGITTITDYSPEWSYPEGGIKVLVTGPWHSTTSPYSVLFDGVSVPASLVQRGVLRCFCPGKFTYNTLKT